MYVSMDSDGSLNGFLRLQDTFECNGMDTQSSQSGGCSLGGSSTVKIIIVDIVIDIQTRGFGK